MDVEAESGAGFHAGRGKVGSRGDLAVIFAARDHDKREARALGHGSIVRQRGRLVGGERSRRAVRRQQRGEAEELRRLCPPQIAPRHGLGDRLACTHALQRVGEGNAEDGAVDPVGRGGNEAGLDLGWTHERSRSVVNGDEVRRRTGQRFETVEHGLLAAAAARHGWGQIQAPRRRLVEFVISRTDHHEDPVDRWRALEGGNGAAQDGLAVQKRILLGQGAAEAAAAAGGDDEGCTTGHTPR
jgi:hypothetical protein